MCNSCPCGSSSIIPGPGEVASALVGVAADSAGSKITRRVLFWGVAIPLLPFAVVGVFGWWTIALVALAAGLAAAGLVFMRKMHRRVLMVAPPSLQHRVALPAGQEWQARLEAIARRRSALPAGRKALPAPQPVITGRVVNPAKVRR